MVLKAVCTAVAHTGGEGGKRDAEIMFLNCLSWQGAQGSAGFRENFGPSSPQCQPGEGCAADLEVGLLQVQAVGQGADTHVEQGIEHWPTLPSLSCKAGPALPQAMDHET